MSERSFFKIAGGYLLSNILFLSIPFLLMPYLTRALSVEDYGLVGLFQTLTVFLVSLFSLSSNSYILRAKYSNVDKGYFFNVIVLVFFIYVLISPVIYFVLYKYVTDNKFLLLLAFLTTFPMIVLNCILALYQSENLVFKYTILQNSLSLTNVLSSIFLIIFVFNGYEGRIYGIFISYFLIMMLALYSLNKNGYLKSKKLEKSLINDAFEFGIKLMPHILGAFLITYYSRFFITNNYEEYSFGIYFLAFQLSSILGVVFDSFNKANTPYVFKLLGENKIFEWKKHCKKINIGLTAIFIFIIFVNEFILKYLVGFIVGDKYLDAVVILKVLLIMQVVRGFYLNYSSVLAFYKMNVVQSIMTIISGSLTVIFIGFSSSVYGLTGIAYLNLISISMMFLITYIIHFWAFKRYG